MNSALNSSSLRQQYCIKFGVKNKNHNFLVNIGDEGFLLSSLMKTFDDEGAYYSEPPR